MQFTFPKFVLYLPFQWHNDHILFCTWLPIHVCYVSVKTGMPSLAHAASSHEKPFQHL